MELRSHKRKQRIHQINSCLIETTYCDLGIEERRFLKMGSFEVEFREFKQLDLKKKT